MAGKAHLKCPIQSKKIYFAAKRKLWKVKTKHEKRLLLWDMSPTNYSDQKLRFLPVVENDIYWKPSNYKKIVNVPTNLCMKIVYSVIGLLLSKSSVIWFEKMTKTVWKCSNRHTHTYKLLEKTCLMPILASIQAFLI